MAVKKKTTKKTTTSKKAKSFEDYLNDPKSLEVKSLVPQDDETDVSSVTRWMPLSDICKDIFKFDALPFGQLIHLFAKKDVGKTTVLMELMIDCVENGIIPHLILTEPKFDWGRYINHFGGNRKHVRLHEPEFIEDVFYIIDELMEKLLADPNHPPIWVFLDSIGGTDARETDVKDWSSDNGRFAQALKKLLRRLQRKVARNEELKGRIGFLFLNQVWDKRIQIGPKTISKEQPNGGESSQHYFSIEIHMKKGSEVTAKVNGRDNVIGQGVVVSVIKNHVNGYKTKAKLFIGPNGFAVDQDELRSNYKEWLRVEKQLKKDRESIDNEEESQQRP